MESMREMLRRQLGRSLEALPELARLEAAWPVACGSRTAARGSIVGLEDGMLRVDAEDEIWLAQMMAMRGMLERELSRIAGVKLRGIHFELKKI